MQSNNADLMVDNVQANHLQFKRAREFTSNGLKRIHDFASSSENDGKSTYETKKYHRLIEKRRRDRINECIYQLKDLLPHELRKTTNKPMEKAVILEMVVSYMQLLAEDREKNENKSECDYIKGYNSCKNQVSNYFTSKKEQHNKEGVVQHLEEALPLALREIEAETMDPGSICEENRINSSSDSCSPKSPQSEVVVSSYEKTVNNSPSALSSSSSSDRSLFRENNSDSSGSDNHSQKTRKKVFHHHRSTNVSNQSKNHTSSPVVSTSVSQNMPVFINMPFVMNPGMISATQYVTGERNDTAPAMPCLIKQSPMQMTTGMMMPQICSDATTGEQKCRHFMFQPVVAPVQQVEQQHQVTNGPEKQQQKIVAEPMMLQPTMMMPFQNQGGFICMPSFSIAPQFTGSPITS